MLKYAKIIDEEKHTVAVISDSKLAERYGYVEMDVQQGWDSKWYLAGMVPEQPSYDVKITDEEKLRDLENENNMFRWQREMILSEGSNASIWAKNKAFEIEKLAQKVRKKNAENR